MSVTRGIVPGRQRLEDRLSLRLIGKNKLCNWIVISPKGEAYEHYVADKLGITAGKDGWVDQGVDDAFPGRKLDWMNLEDRIAIEAKSGVLNPTNIRAQLEKDAEGLRNGWSVKWILHENPSPEVKAIFDDLKLKYPSFSYQIMK